MRDQAQITRIIQRWQAGDAAAVDDLMPLIYRDLKQLARRRMAAESQGHTLQTTALVHEAYVRALGIETPIASRSHLLALIARVMRQVLVDHARTRGRGKRGGGARPIALDDAPTLADVEDPAFLDLEDALQGLKKIAPRKEEIIVAHYFGGLQREEIAAALDISVPTVDRDLRFARAWLHKELQHVAGA